MSKRFAAAFIFVLLAAASCSSPRGSAEGKAVCQKLIPIGKRLGLDVDESAKAVRECSLEMDKMKKEFGQSAFNEFVVCLDSVESEAAIVACHPKFK